jgi:hypothetical protein
MSKPQRIQLSRRKGFRLQETSLALNGLPCVKVDRSTRWGNPMVVDECLIEVCGSREAAIESCVLGFRQWIDDGTNHCSDNPPPSKEDIRRHLRGKNLACWCPFGSPCHADVLLEIANQEEES